MGAIYRNGYKYGDGNGVAQNPVLAIKSGDELYKPENGVVELPDFNEAIEDNAITNTASAAVITLNDTADSNPLALTVYGKSEVVDNAIISAGEGWATVDLGTLNWTKPIGEVYVYYAKISENIPEAMVPAEQTKYLFIGKYAKSAMPNIQNTGDKTYFQYGKYVYIRDDVYTTPTAFKTAMSGVILAYKEATPTNNTIAVKTDNGTGIDGTMAVFETGTPLHGVSDTVRDVMVWDGSSGEVTKNCNVLNMGGLTWNKADNGRMYSGPITGIKRPANSNTLPNIVNPIYTPDTDYNVNHLASDKTIAIGNDYRVYVYDTDYTDATAFKTAMSGVMLVYQLATPVTTPLTSAEVNAFKQLRTYDPNTTVSNNADSVMDIRYYKNSTNGNAVKDIDKAVDEVNERVPKKIETPHTTTEIDCGVAEDVTFSGLTYFRSNNIWTDGTDVYYSYATDQYVLSPLTRTWTAKTWTGLTDFYGGNIWTDGENIYYSYNENQYVLDKSTSTWSAKTWNGLSNFGGSNTWTDGENIYYSGSSNHYVLDKSTSTWSTKTWSSAPNYFSGNRVWSDGENIYYSAGTSQYVLDKDTSTWKAKTWNGLTSFSGDYIWTDGKNIYYSKNQEQYVLNKLTSTWIAKTWINTSHLQGTNVWTDGETLYCTENNNVHKKLTPSLTYKSVRLR